MPATLGSLPNLVFLDVSDNLFTGAPVSFFASSAIGLSSTATYDLSSNYFIAPPTAYTAKTASFCPTTLAGGYAYYNLLAFGTSPTSSQRENCFLGGNYNVSESWTDSKGRSNGKGANVKNKAGAVIMTGTGCPVGGQRRAVECVAFCGAALPAGPCGGQGTCVIDDTTRQPVCLCNSGYYNVTKTVLVAKMTVAYASCSATPSTTPTPSPPPIDDDTWKQRGYRGAQQDGAALLSGSYYNKYFRYASLGFTGTLSAPKWSLASSVDWTARIPSALLGAKNQGSCSACWIFAPVAAVESLYAIVYNAAPPNMSEQKAIDCQGTWACDGGRPDDAFDYIAVSGGLPLSAAYPYTGILNSALCMLSQRYRSRRLLSADADSALTGPELHESAHAMSAAVNRYLLSRGRHATTVKKAAPPSLPLPPYTISMFETVGISGWLGLALAVQKQPVVVYISGQSDSFRNYTGGFVYSDPACFADGIIDHLVVVVGFNLLDATPYWIIRNSWGPTWGDNGYMKIAIAGGAGICGMNVMPGLYPVLRAPNPCSPINPCGGGSCTAVANNKNQLNKCTCPTNFVAVTNLDKTQTCTIAKVCSFFAFNPCGAGTCVDDSKGGYSCLCSPSYVLGQRTDGDSTCIPAPDGPTITSVVLPTAMTCWQVRSTYRLSKKDFQALNPKLKCAGLFASGTTIVIRNATSANATLACVTPYTVASGDTCASIASFFNITQPKLISLNPDLECGALTPGQQLCLEQGTPQALQCTNYYTVNPGETCADITINADPPITADQLYQSNPGLICSSDGSQRLVGQDICVDSAVVGACYYGTYKVVSGDTCGGIACKVYGCSTYRMSKCNGGWVCSSSNLYVGKVLCRCP
eukprot:TRINITY_DN12550_c0_g3_i1.p1 TRINITY_DN12550_c0_g3~~TRINITY_DN12550_c0_g3_i1.p1  ORF type:complete len:968 (+),score=15.40 TRINITY_DN12550_c0_g3_i1:305-2905(+)